MSRFLSLKYLVFSAVFFIVATDGYGYELPAESPDSDQAAPVPLRLDFTDNPMQGRIAHLDSDASTLQHQFSQTGGFSISSSYSNRLLDPFSTDGEVDMDGFWDLRLSTPKTDTLPGIEMDFSVGGFDGETGSDFGDSANQRIKIKTSHTLGFLEYGTSYQMVGKDYDVVDKKSKFKDKDRNRLTTNSWIGRSFGELYVSQFMEQKRSNIDDSSKPETTDSLLGTSLRYTLLNWPYVGTTFSYASGDRESDAGFDIGITSLNGGISASHNKWNMDFYVSQTSPDGSAGSDFGQPKDTNYYLGGSYYPNKYLVITPYVSHNTLTYEDWGVESETMSTAVSVVYRPKNSDYSINLYASYDSQETAEWAVDTNYFYSEAGIKWDLWDKENSRNYLALTFGYNLYEDAIYSGSSFDDFSVKISFKSYSLDRILNSRNVSTHHNYERKHYSNYQQELWLESERRYLELQSTPETALNQYRSAVERGNLIQNYINSNLPSNQQIDVEPYILEKKAEPADSASQEEDRLQSSAMDNGLWFINFGSYHNRFFAEELQQELIPVVGKVAITAASNKGETVYRVRITGLETRQKAEVLARRCEESTELGKLWVGKS